MPHFVNQADHPNTGSPFVLNLEDALIALIAKQKVADQGTGLN